MNPTLCFCGAPMMRRQSKHGPFYSCTRWPDCDGTHGTHPDGTPLGIPTDRAGRLARIRAHTAFDAWWKARGMSRKSAYLWLANHGPKPHIAEMTAEDCERLIGLLQPATMGL